LLNAAYRKVFTVHFNDRSKSNRRFGVEVQLQNYEKFDTVISKGTRDQNVLEVSTHAELLVLLSC
jgi:hypothetical protein